MISHKASSLSDSSTSSAESKATALTDWDSDAEASGGSDASFRPRTLLMMPGPQRPNLSQILANTSPAPWTLAAFIAYLASNHCLETLEFTMDARRYRSHYSSMMERATDGQLPPNQDRDLVQSLWTRLIRAYIRPNGTREVNLSSDVRDPILCVHEQMGEMPPDPDHLKPAVDQMYDLMESSVLVPFLNSLSPPPPLSLPPLQTLSSPPPQPCSVSAKTAQSSASSSRTHSPVNQKAKNISSSLRRARQSVRISPVSGSKSSDNAFGPAADQGGGNVGVGENSTSRKTRYSFPRENNDSQADNSPTSTVSPSSTAPRARDSGMWRKLGGRFSSGVNRVAKRKSQALREES